MDDIFVTCPSCFKGTNHDTGELFTIFKCFSCGKFHCYSNLKNGCLVPDNDGDARCNKCGGKTVGRVGRTAYSHEFMSATEERDGKLYFG